MRSLSSPREHFLDGGFCMQGLKIFRKIRLSHWHFCPEIVRKWRMASARLSGCKTYYVCAVLPGYCNWPLIWLGTQRRREKVIDENGVYILIVCSLQTFWCSHKIVQYLSFFIYWKKKQNILPCYFSQRSLQHGIFCKSEYVYRNSFYILYMYKGWTE